MERQSHGFIYEKRVIENYENLMSYEEYCDVYPCIENESRYTSKYDAIDMSKKGKNYIGKPVQIKNIKHKSSIDLGDVFRNANKEENFDLYVGFWKNNKLNIIEEYFINVDFKKWNDLFSYDNYEEWKHWIKYEVSNSYDYDDQWKIDCDKRKKSWGHNRIIQPRFKRDHKKQRRIQCGVSYKNFIEFFINKKIVSE